MSFKTTTGAVVLTLLFTGLAISSFSYAQPPDFAQPGQAKGKNKDNKDNNDNKDNKDRNRTDGKRPDKQKDNKDKSRNAGNADLSISLHFNANQRDTVRSYYHDMYRQGKCPPGLAKKKNGCQPPGQAKKWRKGFPLDAGVTFYDVDSRLLARLGRPPSGYKYVRVASDILMLAVGTNLVVDAIENLGNY